MAVAAADHHLLARGPWLLLADVCYLLRHSLPFYFRWLVTKYVPAWDCPTLKRAGGIRETSTDGGIWRVDESFVWLY